MFTKVHQLISFNKHIALDQEQTDNSLTIYVVQQVLIYLTIGNKWCWFLFDGTSTLELESLKKIIKIVLWICIRKLHGSASVGDLVAVESSFNCYHRAIILDLISVNKRNEPETVNIRLIDNGRYQYDIRVRIQTILWYLCLIREFCLLGLVFIVQIPNRVVLVLLLGGSKKTGSFYKNI